MGVLTENSEVLLTGISGFIGLHCAQQLLEVGYKVRGSVRNSSKADEVHETLARASADIGNLTIVELDLTSDTGWADAADGCKYVMHVASPFAIANPKSEDDMIVPAVNGTLRALRAASDAGVTRVVLTSSIMAMMGSMKTGTFGPNDWTDTSAANVSTYTKSKTLAEKAAWEFVKSQNGPELVSICPGAVLGPPLGRNITGQTMTTIDRMLRGKIPMLPDFSLPMVDVRDVAKLHVQALTHPDVAGKRIVAATAEPGSYLEVARILKDSGYKGPSAKIAPGFALRLMSLFDREAEGMVGMLGMNLNADNSETRSLFDWNPRPFRQSVIDTAAAVEAARR